jgi:hypothetical protein
VQHTSLMRGGDTEVCVLLRSVVWSCVNARLRNSCGQVIFWVNLGAFVLLAVGVEAHKRLLQLDPHIDRLLLLQASASTGPTH